VKKCSLPGTTVGTFTGAANGGQMFGFEVRVDGTAIERNYLAGARVELTLSAQSVSKLSLVTGAIYSEIRGVARELSREEMTS
jgi:hypothetical protein